MIGRHRLWRVILAAAVGNFLGVPAAAQYGADKPSPPTVRHPVEDFAQLPFLEDPKISPDGRHILAKMALRGIQFLGVLSPYDKAAQPRLIEQANADILWWRWVNDDWAIVALGKRQDVDNSPFFMRRLISINTKTMEVQKIKWDSSGEDAADILWVAHDGAPQILLSYQDALSLKRTFWPAVSRIDVSTGEEQTVERSTDYVYAWHADGQGNVRTAIQVFDIPGVAKLLYRSPGGAHLHSVESVKYRNGEELSIPAMFLSDPDKAVAFSKKDGFEALYGLDLSTFKLGGKVFGVPGHDIDSIVTNDAETELLGVRYVDEAPRTHWFDTGMAKLQSDIDKALGQRNGQIVSMDRTRSHFIVKVGAADSPSAFYLYAPEDGAMFLLAQQYVGLGKIATNPVKTITYKARDGLEIHAVLTLPKERDAKGLPLIVLPHGVISARDAETWDWWTQFLADRGYAVIQPNYRGSSGYGEAFAQKGEGAWGLAMQDDLNDAVDWAAAQGIADAKRVCIVGASYGGYAALRAAERDGAKFRCAVSFAGVSDLKEMSKYDSQYLGNDVLWLKKQAPDFKAVSPINFPKQFSTPVLLVHGKMDRRVEVSQSREMADALKAAGKTYRYVELPLGDHQLSRYEDRLQFLKELEAFLDQYNPA